MIQPWTKKNSKTTYKDSWLSVRTDHCITSHGHEMPDYHVIEYPDWINVIAITPDLEIVLATEYKHGAEIILTNIIGGTVEPEDQSPLITAQRELEEETGYQAPHWFEVGSFYVNPTIQNNKIFSYLAIDAKPTGTKQLDQSEEISVTLMPFPQFIKNSLSTPLHPHILYYAALCSTINFIKNGSESCLSKLKPLVSCKDSVVSYNEK